MALTYAGYMLLAQQLLGGRHKAVAVAALLFFLNGGLGFLYDFDLAFTDNFAAFARFSPGITERRPISPTSICVFPTSLRI